MPKIQYKEFRGLRRTTLELIDKVNDILDDYNSRGYSMTLRQVYYQLVSQNVIPNKESSYKMLGETINTGRLAGLIDWRGIEDRTRNLQGRTSWRSASEMIHSAYASFHRNQWEGQETHVEVWVEKDALKGIVEQACYPLDVDYFSCRGYTSQSEMWQASQRLIRKQTTHKHLLILHFGDHDPSGIDMSRDIEERLEMFGVDNLDFRRIALNMDQIEEFNPPPNPTKITDSRSPGYIAQYGRTCWELDALRPETLEELIRREVEPYIDRAILNKVKAQEKKHKDILHTLYENWEAVEDNFDAICEEYFND